MQKIDIDTKIGTNTKISTQELIFDFPRTTTEISINVMPTQFKM